MIEAVIFDMDGVIVDTEPVYYKRMQDFLAHHQVDFDKRELTHLVGSTEEDVWKWVQGLWDGDLSREKYDKAYGDLYEGEPVSYQDIVDQEIYDVLDWLKKENYKVGLASSSSFANIESVLEQCQLTHYFDSILSGEMFEQSKPHPEIYLNSAKKLDVHPNYCLAIEDSTRGIKAGKAAGMTVFAKKDDRFNFQQDLADKKIKSLKEIMEELKK